METILIVDDNADLRLTLSAILKDEGYKTLSAGDGKTALSKMQSSKPDLIMLDMRLPDMSGMHTLQEVKKINEDTPVIMLTAYGDVKTAVDAMKNGAFDYVQKPFDNDELILTIKRALSTGSLTKEVKVLRKQLDRKFNPGVIGTSEPMNNVMKQIELIAPTNMTVVLQGESGTGKEVFSTLVHQMSLRKDKQLVAIDCGAIPESLIESELFGFEKGSFTGADKYKEGKFEQANGGTLFLDEITNLSEGNQAKLLRVIQEKKVTRIGGKKDMVIDVRIVAATNIKLLDAVANGKFRSDLYYRLNEFIIDLPTLRDRLEDVPALVEHFMVEANEELNKDVTDVSKEAMKILVNYKYPGNVRELRNIVRRAVLMADSDTIKPENLMITSAVSNDGEDTASASKKKSKK